MMLDSNKTMLYWNGAEQIRGCAAQLANSCNKRLSTFIKD
jgi:hypothetical protein